MDSKMSDDDRVIPRFIREFIYVDVDRARVLLSQLSGSVVEGFKLVSESSKDRGLGVSRATYLRGGETHGSEEAHSLVDSLIPALEELLEANGAVTDISDSIEDDEDMNLEGLNARLASGSVVRLTALGQLFDSTFVAESLAAIFTAVNGVSALNAGNTKQSGNAKVAIKPSRDRRQPDAFAHRELEDLIPVIENTDLGFGTDHIRAIVRTTRGIFPAGLHLVMSSQQGRTWSALARLQKDRKYLDAEPDILFSRYGTGKSLWTVLGTVGHFAGAERPDMSKLNDGLVRDDQSVDRAGFVAMVNGLMEFMGSLGFSSAPSYPGLSIVPIAVYRTVEIGPWPAG